MVTLNKNSIVFRVDSSEKIGLGHLMRCIALGQKWVEKYGAVFFLTYCDTDVLKNMIIEQGFEYIPINKNLPEADDIDLTTNLLKTFDSDIWVVADGYHFTPEYHRRIRLPGVKLLVIDDFNHNPYYSADIVLNPNIGGEDFHYKGKDGLQTLLGAKYALLRKDFIDFKYSMQKNVREAPRILITMGGTDCNNVSLKILMALNHINDIDFDVKVIIGPSNPHIDALEKYSQNNCSKIELIKSVTNISPLIHWADIAFTAGGSTCIEMAFAGLPFLAVILEENQKHGVLAMEKNNFAVNLGDYRHLDNNAIIGKFLGLWNNKKNMSDFSKKSRGIVDGKGTTRIVDIMNANQHKLREIDVKDCELLWEWANDEEARKNSFYPEFIPLDIHKKWFEDQLNSCDSHIYIAQDQLNIPVAQARFNKKGSQSAYISVSINKANRGNGIGAWVIKNATKKYVQAEDIKEVYALIKEDNLKSVKAFKTSGYKEITSEMYKGTRILRLVYRSDT